MSDFLNAFRLQVRKRGASTASISPIAEDLAIVTAHHFAMTWQDVADLRQEVKKLRAELTAMAKEEA